MDLTELLTNMMLDLKMTLDTEITTAEATRCIHRAVDDMSRHLPRERIYEHTWIKEVTDDSFTTPAALNATSIVNAADISATTSGGTLTLTSQSLDVPRPVAVLLTDANNSITALTLIVKGFDGAGVYREEKFFRYNGKSQIGKIYFSWITEAEVNYISGNGAADTLSIGTADPDTAGREVWVSLTQPMEPDTLSIYSAASKSGTKYTQDTDYEVDWYNGRVRLKSGGSMSEGATYYANYDRHGVMVDISSIIPELIRIVKVIYPANKIPQQSIAFSVWENMLIVGSQKAGESQKSLTDKDHLVIFYEGKHSPPTYQGSGSYPEQLDQVVLIGAVGYALLVEALQYELQAVTDLASARTELGLTTAIHTLTATALGKVATYLETNGTTDNAADVLANITDDIADLRTAIKTALDAANAELDAGDLSDMATHISSAASALAKVSTFLENNSGDDAESILAGITDDANTLRTAIATAVDAANAFLDAVDTTDLGQATVGAEGLLETGDDLINQLNVGKGVPELYADYSRVRATHAGARTSAAIGFIQEALARLQNLSTYITESDGWTKIAMGFVAEAEHEVAMASQIAARENVVATQAGIYIEEAKARIDNLRSYIEESGAWVVIGKTFVDEAAGRLQEIQTHLAECERWEQVIDRDMLLSDRYRVEATNRLNEFHTILSNRAEYRKRLVDIPVRQPK